MRSSRLDRPRPFYLSEDAKAVIDADFTEIRPQPRGWWDKLKKEYKQWLMRLRFQQ